MSDLIRREDAIKALTIAIDEHTDIFDAIKGIPSADRPQGYWIKVDTATYRCSECEKIQIADDSNELNYCCNCGSHNASTRIVANGNCPICHRRLEGGRLFLCEECSEKVARTIWEGHFSGPCKNTKGVDDEVLRQL